jgi:hypothetical protein
LVTTSMIFDRHEGKRINGIAPVDKQ